ncbi:MAG: ABC transporter permease [Bacteroidaceae bacterium]|nr:ABC transporter permease [Bacteroidaceae bacterium]
MNKILIIIRREFLTKVSKKSFIILTVLMPFIFAALIFVPLALAGIKDSDQKQVGVVDKTGLYTDVLQSDAQYAFILLPDTTAELRADDSPMEAVVYISDTLATNPRALTIYSNKEVSAELLSLVQSRLTERVRSDKLSSYNVSGLERIIDDVQAEVSGNTVKWAADGSEKSSNTGIAIGAGFLFTFLIYMFVMAYGAMVMQSVLEEKTGRIVELMVSSVKPFQLMMGKIIGIALVGFVQLIIWGVMLAVIITACVFIFGPSAAPADVAAIHGTGAAAVQAAVQAASQGGAQEALEALTGLPFAEMGVMFVLYFVGGYLLYASFFAAVGASVSQQEDASQFTMPVILLMVFGLYAAMYSIENTNGPLAFWASMFPLTSPIVMMVRIPFGVPLWEEALSLALLFATSLATVWLGAKIYRVGILMYGKKPSLKELVKWMRYK